MKYAAKTGAVFYLLWGLIHIVGGFSMLMSAEAGNVSFLEMISDSSDLSFNTENLLAGLVINKIFFYHSFNILWLGLVCGIIAVTMNWKNSRTGFWINLALVGFTDAGLLIFMVVPGIMTFSNASPGLLLFILALFFSTMAIRKLKAD